MAWAYAWNVLLVFWLCLTTWQDIQLRKVANKYQIWALTVQTLYLFLTSTFEITFNPFLSSNWFDSITGFLTGLIVFFPLWRFRAMGAGDVKFIAVFGYCVGIAGLLPALLLGSMLGGVHALLAILLQGWPAAQDMWKSPVEIRRGIPYAAYIALGALFGMGWLMFHPEPWLSSL